MPLSTRISLMVAVLLGVSGAFACAAFYQSVRRSLNNEIEGRLAARMAWLEAAISVDLDGDKRFVRLEERGEPQNAASRWRISTIDRKLLWSSPTQTDTGQSARRDKFVAFGTGQRSPLTGLELVARWDPSKRREDKRVELGSIPPATMEAVRKALPGIDIVHADRRNRRNEDGSPINLLALEGRLGGRGYRIEVENQGEIGRIKDEGFVEYDVLRRHGSLQLLLESSESTAPTQAELSRLARSLWAIAPAALLLTSGLLTLLIRWQLDPLRRMAAEAARIGPAKTLRTISPAHSAPEYLRLSEALNSMIARLAEGLERERNFASIAAHELRTPLAQLRAAAEIALRRERPADEYRQALTDVLADAQRLEKLISALLQLTRLQAGERPALDRIALKPAIIRAVALAGLSDVALNGISDDAAIAGNADLVTSAIANVLANAARYAPGRPPELSMEQRNTVVELIVADHGPGIAPESRESIFQPLVRLDAARGLGDSPDGFGLGLAVARSAMRAMGGDLFCRGREDGQSGAAFIFRFQRLEGSNLHLSPA